MSLPRLRHGKRLFLAGKTGSGKTQMMRDYLRKNNQHQIIIDTKGELGDMGKVTSSPNEAIKNAQRHVVSVYVPKRGYNSPRNIDDFIGDLHESYSNICLGIDEAYSVHNNGHCYSGLLAWITRGRSLKQTLICCSQRPAWVSMMLISETNLIGVGKLELPGDRKRLTEATGLASFMSTPNQDHVFRFYDLDNKRTGLYTLRLDA